MSEEKDLLKLGDPGPEDVPVEEEQQKDEEEILQDEEDAKNSGEQTDEIPEEKEEEKEENDEPTDYKLEVVFTDPYNSDPSELEEYIREAIKDEGYTVKSITLTETE